VLARSVASGSTGRSRRRANPSSRRCSNARPLGPYSGRGGKGCRVAATSAERTDGPALNLARLSAESEILTALGRLPRSHQEQLRLESAVGLAVRVRRLRRAGSTRAADCNAELLARDWSGSASQRSRCTIPALSFLSRLNWIADRCRSSPTASTSSAGLLIPTGQMAFRNIRWCSLVEPRKITNPPTWC